MVLLLFLHAREEDVTVVVEASAAHAIPEAEVFGHVNPSRPERDARVLGDRLEIGRAVGQSEALPVDRQCGDPGHEAIHVVTASDPRVGPPLRLLERLSGFGDAESLFRDIATAAASQEFLPVHFSEIVILTAPTELGAGL